MRSARSPAASGWRRHCGQAVASGLLPLVLALFCCSASSTRPAPQRLPPVEGFADLVERGGAGRGQHLDAQGR